MRKVAIMTWYHYNNYGTVLQACALSAVIAKLGYEVSVISHVPQPPEQPPLINQLSNPTWMTHKVASKLHRPLLEDPARRQEFDRFREQHLVFTTPCETSSELWGLNGDYDAFVCGSDQIWAPSLFYAELLVDLQDNRKSPQQMAREYCLPYERSLRLQRCAERVLSRLK